MNQGPLQHFESGWAIEKKKNRSVGLRGTSEQSIYVTSLYNI